MLKKTVIAGAVAAAMLVGLMLARSDGESAKHAFIEASDQTLVTRGKAIYATHCASCHGSELQGQADWRTRRPDGRLPAPPHDESGHTWHHPDSVLIDIVKNGLVPGKTAPENYESDMPAYGKILDDADIRAVLAYIKSHWSAEALKAQREVSLQSSGN